MTSLNSSVSTERGNVVVSYTRSDDSYDIDITIPTNMTADVKLPVIGNGKFVEKNGMADDISNNSITVGSGKYSFSYEGNITVLPEKVEYKEPLPEGIFGKVDTNVKTYTWGIGENDIAAENGVTYSDKNDYADLTVSLAKGDSLNGSVLWSASSVRETNTSGQKNLSDTKRYLIVKPKFDGTFNFDIAFKEASDRKKNRVYVADLGLNADTSNIDLSEYSKDSSNKTTVGSDVTSTNTVTKNINMTANHVYMIYTYQTGSTISAMSYTYNEEVISTPSPTTLPTTLPTQQPLIPTPEVKPTNNKKYMHISFDDVYLCLKDITDNQYNSIFENSFFADLKKLHDDYGAVFTLNCFNAYSKDSSYSISNLPDRYAEEFKANSDWLKFAFHAENDKTIYGETSATRSGVLATPTQSVTSYNKFVSSIMQATGNNVESIDTVTRLGFFSGNNDNVSAMQNCEYGITGLLSADDTRLSYYFDNELNDYIIDNNDYYDTDKNLRLIRTQTRLESVKDTSSTLDGLMNYSGDILEIFTHESEYKGSVVNRLKSYVEWAYQNGYGFDYAMNVQGRLIKILNKSTDGNKVDYALQISAGNGATVIAASYNEDKSLYALQTVAVVDNKANLSVEIPNDKAEVKIMLWDSLSKMKPISMSIQPLLTESVTATATPSPKPSYIPEENPSEHWDFAKYSGDSAINNITESKTISYQYCQNSDTLEIGLNSGDSISENGIFWSAPSGVSSDNKTTVSNNRYIKYIPSSDGTLSITYKGSANASNKHPRIYISCGNGLDCTTKESNTSQIEDNQSFDNNSTDFKTAEFKLSKGKTYYIWSYYYNSTANQFTISDIAFNKAEETVRTRNIYGSNMLLQRNQSIIIDGKADAVDTVSVTLTNETTNEVVQTVESRAASSENSWSNKDWSVTLNAVSDYSSTYKLSISAQNTENIEYTNIIFGDLYLFSGQSNMWKQVSYYKNIDSEAYGTTAVMANATDKIRVMHTQGSSDVGTAILQYDALNAQPWRDFSTYDNVSDISAPAYTAAVKMYKETGVPIGLIKNAYPGSYISSWFDSALKIDVCNEGRNKTSNERNWYCGRIYPLRNLKLSGIFWYQGCADAATTYHDNPYEYYSEKMSKLIETWRELFNNDTLPFYYVQLSRIGSTIVDENNPDTGSAGKMPIKRAQTDVYLNMKDKTNIGIISTLDLYGNHNADGVANCRNDIHLGQKNIIGERMAAYALKDIYGQNVYSHGPIYKSSEVQNGKIIVTFDCNGQLQIMPSSQYTDTTGELKIENGEINPNELNEFEIAGTDGVWHRAKAEITADNQVTVSCDDVTLPVKVRYCGTDYPESPNLTDESGLPSYVFEKTAEITE